MRTVFETLCKWAVVTVAGIALVSCASLRSVSLTPIPEDRKNEVSASSHKWIILGLSFDNDYADEIVAKLRDRCRGGQVKGILTKDENFNYFIGFVMKRQIIASGYCLKG